MKTASVTLTGPCRWHLLLVVGVFFAAGGIFNGEARAATRWETLEAIHWVENPYNRSAPGPCGELGAYQFRMETWHKYTRLPFTEALDRSRSDEIAIRHYDWLKTSLERNGFEASVYNIAIAWNAGLGAVTGGRAPAVSRDYAQRVENIANEISRRQQQLAYAKRVEAIGNEFRAGQQQLADAR